MNTINLLMQDVKDRIEESIKGYFGPNKKLPFVFYGTTSELEHYASVHKSDSVASIDKRPTITFYPILGDSNLSQMPGYQLTNFMLRVYIKVNETGANENGTLVDVTSSHEVLNLASMVLDDFSKNTMFNFGYFKGTSKFVTPEDQPKDSTTMIVDFDFACYGSGPNRLLNSW